MYGWLILDFTPKYLPPLFRLNKNLNTLFSFFFEIFFGMVDLRHELSDAKGKGPNFKIMIIIIITIITGF